MELHLVSLARPHETMNTDALSPMGMKMAKKQVLKKGGVGASMDSGWGLKPVKDLEKWDEKIKVIGVTRMSNGMYRGLPLMTKLVFAIPDMLGICKMVHMRIESPE